jgi:hypothetical protein
MKKSFRNGEVLATFIGCLFHWKQAVRQHLVKKIHLDRHIITKLIGEGGILDVLTIIPPDEVKSKGIPFCKSQIALVDPLASTTHAEKYDHFWKYFEATWLKYYAISDWNVHQFYLKYLDGKLTPDEMINRANNPLESYNRTFNDQFTNKPSMEYFVAVIRKMSRKYWEDIKSIQRNSLQMRVREVPKFPTMPTDYADYVVPAAPFIPAAAVDGAAIVHAPGVAVPLIDPVVAAPIIGAYPVNAGLIIPAAAAAAADGNPGQVVPLIPPAVRGAALAGPVEAGRIIPAAAANGAPFVPAAAGVVAPLVPAAVAAAPAAAAIGGDERPYTEFLQDPNLYRDTSSDEEEIQAGPIVAASKGAMTKKAPKPTASNNKAQDNKQGGGHAAKKPKPKPRPVENSFDFKPTSYRKRAASEN